jgi:diacylglycerol kinase (ATP)
MSISLSAGPSPAERDALRSPRSPPAASPAPLVGALIESLSFRSCGFGRAATSAFEKEDLRLRAAFPQRLRDAVHAALKARDPSAGAFALAEAPGVGGAAANPWFALAPEDAPENPLVAFVNPRSGGRLGPVLKTRLQELIGEDQVKPPPPWLSFLPPSYVRIHHIGFALRGVVCERVMRWPPSDATWSSCRGAAAAGTRGRSRGSRRR